MIIDSSIKMDVYGEYCIKCYASKPTDTQSSSLKSFHCSACKVVSDRKLIIDPKIKSWIDAEGLYFHESVGIILINPDKQLLFYKLTKFPYDYTIPAGHVDVDEMPLDAITRETFEEVGITLESPRLLTRVMVRDDSCRRGCDDHNWSLFAQYISSEQVEQLSVDAHEGKKPTWVFIDEVESLRLTPAMKFLFTEYLKDIEPVL